MLVSTATLAAAVAQAGLPHSAGGRSWKVTPTPNPARADISGLSSVSCPSQRVCIAVGSSARSLSSSTLTLAERWDGSRWHIQSIPTPKATSDSLYGVSCPSTRACTAVGSAYQTAGGRQTVLIETWNGKRWRVQTTPKLPARDSSLEAVSCVSVRWCVAVGYSQVAQPIIERWNGKAWHIQALSRAAKNTRLFGVSCSSTRACTAVGYTTGTPRPVAVSWNGKLWRVRTMPVPQGAPGAIIEAVSCTSAVACTATGSDFTHPGGPTLAERWNGKTWRVQATPNPADFAQSRSEVTLDGVSCSSARACTATGEYNPNHADYFVESWNGQAWRLEAVPHPGDFLHGALLGISCRAARCTAVGAYTGDRTVRLQVNLAMTG